LLVLPVPPPSHFLAEQMLKLEPVNLHLVCTLHNRHHTLTHARTHARTHTHTHTQKPLTNVTGIAAEYFATRHVSASRPRSCRCVVCCVCVCVCVCVVCVCVCVCVCGRLWLTSVCLAVRERHPKLWMVGPLSDGTDGAPVDADTLMADWFGPLFRD
jgi:hypothetical protein